ncbi:tyrosine-protein phosphatase non-receptor type 21 [Centruroides vittatus]|uniref:tyrosine-protein phosphatase non-receptor type 21 n=1 Tax=Centruroides vittatus TaxID=120091 RepID=UPI00350F2BF2
MPFKLKLKKSRQYNVVSKNLFVISVELLDNTTVECTLSSQSIGQECLHNVCQRLGLQQPMYFGLRFLSKRGTFWWIDLERPLKKQLDKYAQECCLYLGVMFFVSDVSLLHDEVTRYHYFLQLKKDIIDGKLQCNKEQAILLASYSLQAEFGDHDPKRHSIEYLSNFVLLPKNMISGKENQEALMEQVISTHISLQNLSPARAEVYYIMEAQQIAGYGQEIFPGKDSSGLELIIGISSAGITVKYQNSHSTLYFKWQEIINIIHHKKIFGIECHKTLKQIQFQMEDSHFASYVWKICVNQHRFYTQHESTKSTEAINEEEPVEGTNKIKNTENNSVLENLNYEKAKSSGDLQASQESLDELGVYHTEGRYSERVPLSCEEQYKTVPDDDKLENRSSVQISSMPVDSLQSLSSGSNTGPNVLSQSSLGSLTQLNETTTVSSYNHQGVNDLEAKQILLPSYRQAPDYETAIRQKYGVNSSNLGDISTSTVYNAMHVNSPAFGENDSSHPYISYYKNYVETMQIEQYSQDGNIADSSVTTNHYDHAALHALLLSPTHTYSTPELASKGLASDNPNNHAASNMHIYYQYKPPPPYPYGQRSSSSTPDLTRNVQGGINQNLVLSHKLDSASNSQLPDQQNRMGSEPTIYPQNSSSVPTRNCQSFTYSEITSKTQPNDQSNLISPTYYLAGNNLQVRENIEASNSTTILNTDILYNYVNQNLMMQHSNQTNDINESSVAHEHIEQPNNSLWNVPPVLTDSDHQKHTFTPNLYQCPEIKGQEANIIHHTQWKNYSHPKITTIQESESIPDTSQEECSHAMGPMLVAAMNGLALSHPDIILTQEEENKKPRDARVQQLENRLAEGQVFLEFEQIIKKKPVDDFSTALLPENLGRNRFKDVLPYEDNRVRITPNKENRTGYINASHIAITVVGTQKFYIAAQGPLSTTVHSFWQMIWEHDVNIIVMLTEIWEQGREKCFPYWPQDDDSNNKLQIGEFQILRNSSISSPTFVTSSLTVNHMISHSQRSVWHIQYTDWPDHSCPQNLQGFLGFMEEINAVRRMANKSQTPGRRTNSPIVVHCSAGVGRTGVVILCDIMLFALDHNEVIDMPKVLTELRLQRMLTVQTIAQYKFVYTVLIQYLKNARLI